MQLKTILLFTQCLVQY